jgi:hypothetical protein
VAVKNVEAKTIHDSVNEQEWSIGKGAIDDGEEPFIVSKVDLKDPVLPAMRSKRQQQLVDYNYKPQIASELRPPIFPEQNIAPETIQTYIHQAIESTTIEETDEVVESCQSFKKYNEKASHESFLKALVEWRQNGKESIDADYENVNSSIAVFSEAETETASESSKINNSVSFEGRVNFQNSLSYFDRLNLNKMRADVKNDEISSSLNGPKPQSIEIISQASNEKDTINEFEDDQIHYYGIQNMPSSNNVQDESNETSEISVNICVEDISDNVDQVILDCLNQGIMVECIPSSKLIFDEPI